MKVFGLTTFKNNLIMFNFNRFFSNSSAPSVSQFLRVIVIANFNVDKGCLLKISKKMVTVLLWRHFQKILFNLTKLKSIIYSFIAYFNNDLKTAVSNSDLNSAQINNNDSINKQADHIQFLITEVTPRIPKSPKTLAASEIVELKHSDDTDKETFDDFQLISDDPLISPQIFCQVFPFHLMFNRQMKIVQAGKSVLRVIPKLADDDCNLLDILDPIRPHVQLSFQSILSHISTIYVLKTKPKVMLEPDMFMRLKVCVMDNY